ncbi:MAG: hypothetical protein M0R02_16220 [Bacteroidales bacterium]|nr:hypothetical protein [Bacteroidales bacterium]
MSEAGVDSASDGSTADGLTGIPSDQSPAILAEGDSGASMLFVSMSERHPEGADAGYLRWHSLDHRPEQYRLPALRSSLRVVSTPACRAARAASSEGFDAVDHVMTYFFADKAGLEGFGTLSKALCDAGRSPFVLNPVQRGVYDVTSRHAALRAKVGADVLPWWPARGVYLLVEEGRAPATDLTAVSGVAGLWCATSAATAFSSAGPGQQLAYCFLDGDPVAVAERLRPLLERRWAETGVRPLLAAPFYTVVPWEWDRYLP